MNLNKTSYTELSVLSTCEMAWVYRYLRGQRSEQTPNQARGTALHEVIAVWWDEPAVSMEELIERIDIYSLVGEDYENREHVEWLLRRYEEHHGPSRSAGVLRMIGHELYFEAQVPGTSVVLRAWVDGLGLDDEGGMWLIERKSMKDWRRLNSLLVDKQVTLYIWLAQVIGLPVKGVIYDATRTYRWKPEKPTQAQLIAEIEAELLPGVAITKKEIKEEAKARQEAHPGVDRPAAESFVTEWLDRTPDHIAEALREVQGAAQRRGALANGAIPMRNIGQGCDWCDHQDDCWSGLATPSSIVLED